MSDSTNPFTSSSDSDLTISIEPSAFRSVGCTFNESGVTVIPPTSVNGRASARTGGYKLLAAKSDTNERSHSLSAARLLPNAFAGRNIVTLTFLVRRYLVRTLEKDGVLVLPSLRPIVLVSC